MEYYIEMYGITEIQRATEKNMLNMRLKDQKSKLDKRENKSEEYIEWESVIVDDEEEEEGCHRRHSKRCADR